MAASAWRRPRAGAARRSGGEDRGQGLVGPVASRSARTDRAAPTYWIWPRDVDLWTDGSGHVDVRAQEHLDVRLDGSGDVRYLGDPRLSQFDDGSGEIKRVR